MSAPVLFSPPAAGFDAPFEMLASCHERVERTLQLLERLADHVVKQGADDQARDAARDVLRYFDTAAPHHHQDEELHLLPALRVAGHDDVADRVLAEHAQMATEWAALRLQLLATASGDAAALSVPAVQAAWRSFAQLYRDHVAYEDCTVFPLAETTLNRDRQTAMGEEMARRRGAVTRLTA
jgi:hemerythrin-like domain-containing protein